MREVTIDGKTYRLETDKTYRPKLAGRKKGSFRLLLEAIQPGESVYLTDLPSNVSGRLSAAGKVLGRKFSRRAERKGARVFCLADEPVAGAVTEAPAHVPKRRGRPPKLSLAA